MNNLDEIIKQIDSLQGLNDFKLKIHNLVSSYKIRELRKSSGLPVGKLEDNLLFLVADPKNNELCKNYYLKVLFMLINEHEKIVEVHTEADLRDLSNIDLGDSVIIVYNLEKIIEEIPEVSQHKALDGLLYSLNVYKNVILISNDENKLAEFLSNFFEIKSKVCRLIRVE